MTTPSPHTTPDGARVFDRPAEPDRDPLDHADRDVLLPTGSGGTLADHGSMLDADGEDIREYTGEPVETDEGWVIPQAQNLGGVVDPADSLRQTGAVRPDDVGSTSDERQTGPDADKPHPSDEQAAENAELDPPA